MTQTVAIEAFIVAYEQTAKPFVWRKREVAGSQLRNTIRNLCNQALVPATDSAGPLVCRRPGNI